MIQLRDLNQSVQSRQANQIQLVATLDTALCVGAGGSSGSQADKPILKTADGRLAIPASQIKGRLRHECEKLTRALEWATCKSPVAQTMCPHRVGLTEHFQRDEYAIGERSSDNLPLYHCLICQIFGNPSLPSRIQFTDLICTEDPNTLPEVLRPGVTINRRRRTAEEKKLYFLETSPANAALRFAGEIFLSPPLCNFTEEQDDGKPDFAKALILAGLKHIHALGGSKSTGLGWLQWEPSIFENAEIDEAVWAFLCRSKSSNSSAQTILNEDKSNETH
ncbi:MAG: RAMP superfamily CRISPR-associated protein [Cyanophyceae cyanobacterium]